MKRRRDRRGRVRKAARAGIQLDAIDESDVAGRRRHEQLAPGPGEHHAHRRAAGRQQQTLREENPEEIGLSGPESDADGKFRA